MSTRCHILIEGTELLIYRHSDGYPDGESGVLATILPFLKTFTDLRGWEPDYLAAQLLYALGADHNRTYDNLLARYREREPDADPPELREGRLLGLGLSTMKEGLHGDEEFIYVVTPNYVEVHQTTHEFWEDPDLKHTKFLKAVKFDGARARRKPRRRDQRANTIPQLRIRRTLNV